MCGICGLIHSKSITPAYDSKQVIIMMREKLAHRGPDQSGEWVNKENEVYLGHRRLSVIDLSDKGRQPMISNCGNYVITFNGEVYNFDLLRTQLKEKGYIFKGNSDTEVVLNMYLEYGINCLKEFNGIFGLAIYDFRSNDLFVARDAMGVKPVYYFSNDEWLQVLVV